MNTYVGTAKYRRSLAVIIASLLFGMFGLPPVNAATPGIGAIDVDSFNCDSGFLDAHVPVTSLEHVSNPTDEADFPFRWTWEAHYDNGSTFSPSEPFFAFNPPAATSPVTGAVPLHDFVPANGPGGGAGPKPLTSIDIEASVGHGGDGPIFSTAITYNVVCGDDLISQLIAVLIQILDDILNG